METASRLMLESTLSHQVATIRQFIDSMRIEEEGMLRHRHQSSEQAVCDHLGAGPVLAVLIIAVLAGYFLVIRRHVVMRAAVGRELRQRSAELKVANSQLRSSELALAAAQEMARIGGWEQDSGKNELRWSGEVYRIFEIDKGRFNASYEAFLGAIDPDDHEKVNAAYTESLMTRRPHRIVHRLRMVDGRIKRVEGRCESEFDAPGETAVLEGTALDVIGLTVIERALRVKDNAIAIATSINAVAISNVDGNIYVCEPDVRPHAGLQGGGRDNRQEKRRIGIPRRDTCQHR